MNSNTYKEYIRPVVVLVLICLVTTGLLALTYGITNPIIQKNAKKTADENRKVLLSDATGFDQYKGKLVTDKSGKAHVEDCYTSTNKTGAVMTVVTKSFGGDLTMMVGIDKDGKITGIKISDHSDTPGVGTKNMTDEYLGQYKGMSKTSSENVKQETQIHYTSGASVTGQALQNGVHCALAQFAAMGGVK
ncbi:MAG: FMN-binding protein [Eubacteriales bacterium]|nr:FMN-binding protein [Eubacteriales bacterium]